MIGALAQPGTRQASFVTFQQDGMRTACSLTAWKIHLHEVNLLLTSASSLKKALLCNKCMRACALHKLVITL